MSVRARAVTTTTTTTTTTTGGRLDAVLRAGLDATPIGRPCPKEIVALNNALKDVETKSDDDIVVMLEKLVLQGCKEDPIWGTLMTKLGSMKNRKGVQRWLEKEAKLKPRGSGMCGNN